MVGATSLWANLNRAAKRADTGRLRLWEWLKEKVDLACYRPQAAPDVVVRALTGRQGPYYILKNPASKTYYRLTDRDLFLWQRMDGTQTVKDLVVAYFLQYGSFAFARVATLVEELKACLFLTEQPVNVYSQIQARLANRNPVHRLDQFWQVFQEKQFAISGAGQRAGQDLPGCGLALLHPSSAVSLPAGQRCGAVPVLPRLPHCRVECSHHRRFLQVGSDWADRRQSAFHLSARDVACSHGQTLWA